MFVDRKWADSPYTFRQRQSGYIYVTDPLVAVQTLNQKSFPSQFYKRRLANRKRRRRLLRPIISNDNINKESTQQHESDINSNPSLSQVIREDPSLYEVTSISPRVPEFNAFKNTKYSSFGPKYGSLSPAYNSLGTDYGPLGPNYSPIGSGYGSFGSQYGSLGSKYDSKGSEYSPLYRQDREYAIDRKHSFSWSEPKHFRTDYQSLTLEPFSRARLLNSRGHNDQLSRRWDGVDPYPAMESSWYNNNNPYMYTNQYRGYDYVISPAVDPYAVLALLGFLVFLFYIIYNFLNNNGGGRSFQAFGGRSLQGGANQTVSLHNPRNVNSSKIENASPSIIENDQEILMILQSIHKFSQ